MSKYRYVDMTKLFNSKCQEFHRFVSYGEHAVRLAGVEIDAIALFQNDGLTTDVQLHSAFEHEVELLTGVRVLVDGASTWLRLYSNNKYIGLVVDETAHQRLVLISFSTLDGHALSLACHIV